MIRLMQGDCIEQMRLVAPGSVHAVICDPPYGTTACKWDSVIQFEPMWDAIWRCLVPNGAVVLFGQEPFSSALRMSAVNQFKYDWYWKKSRPAGFTNARLKPLKDIEAISVFSEGMTANGSKQNMPYHPQGVGEGVEWKRPKKYYTDSATNPARDSHALERKTKGSGYPRQILEFANHNRDQVHPTQKPVALMEYLVNTYTHPGQTVLDFTMGSGTTGVACQNTGRSFIGIERDDKYFQIAKERLG